MELKYSPDTNFLYINLPHHTSVESREISEVIVLDYDESEYVVGIDIDNTSLQVELHGLMVSMMPLVKQTIMG